MASADIALTRELLASGFSGCGALAMVEHGAPSLLIVDDDVDFAASAKSFAETRGYCVNLAHSIQDVRALRHQAYDLVLLDLFLPDGSGFDLLEDFDLPAYGRIAVVTGDPSVETAVQAVALPVGGYLIKPLCPEQFAQLLDEAAQRSAVPIESHGLIGQCSQMRELYRLIDRFGPVDVTALITGESGTGKELVARALHERSGRAGPFVAFNCGALAPELLASELFGHERGSFTGAQARHKGLFERASGGTLFLDEVTEMPLPLQVYLLRVLESGLVTRVGGETELPVNVRVLAACNRDPDRAIAAGQLREDLYYRLADVLIPLPPLRVRGEDVVLLADWFLQRLNVHYGTRKRFAKGTEKALLTHGWPGNVRELRSTVQRAFLLAQDDVIHVQPRPAIAAPEHHGETTILFRVGMTYAQVEREMLLKTLAHFDQDRTRTAEALGVSVRTIHNQLTRLRETSRDDG